MAAAKTSPSEEPGIASGATGNAFHSTAGVEGSDPTPSPGGTLAGGSPQPRGALQGFQPVPGVFRVCRRLCKGTERGQCWQLPCPEPGSVCQILGVREAAGDTV